MLRPTPQRHAAQRGRANTSKEETTTMNSLSPALAATKKEQDPKLRAYENEETPIKKSLSPELTATNQEKRNNTSSRSNWINVLASCSTPSPESNKVRLRIASPSKETTTRKYREQNATLASSPYVPVGPLRQHHEDCNKDISTTRTTKNADRTLEESSRRFPSNKNNQDRGQSFQQKISRRFPSNKNNQERGQNFQQKISKRFPSNKNNKERRQNLPENSSRTNSKSSTMKNVNRTIE